MSELKVANSSFTKAELSIFEVNKSTKLESDAIGLT
jgi:hypothetical protein